MTLTMLTMMRERTKVSLGCWIARVAYFWQATRDIKVLDMTSEIASVKVPTRRVYRSEERMTQKRGENSERKRARGGVGCWPILQVHVVNVSCHILDSSHPVPLLPAQFASFRMLPWNVFSWMLILDEETGNFKHALCFSTTQSGAASVVHSLTLASSFFLANRDRQNNQSLKGGLWSLALFLDIDTKKRSVCFKLFSFLQIYVERISPLNSL